eukprot:507693_1
MVFCAGIFLTIYCLIVNDASYIGSGKRVYGISEQGVDLMQYDVVSGNKTILQKGPSGNSGESLECFDHLNNILYFMMRIGGHPPFKIGLYGYNLSNTEQAIGFTELPMIDASNWDRYVTQCVGDPNNGNVYVFGLSSTNHSEQLLLKVYRNNTNLSNVIIETLATYSNIDDALLFPGEITIFDSKRNKLWVAGAAPNGTEYYYYIDAISGNIENRKDIIIWCSFYACNYDINLDKIVGVNFNGYEPDKEAEYAMHHADPVTLNVTKTFPPFKEWCFMSTIGAINDMNQIYYNLLYNSTQPCQENNGAIIPHLVGVNITNGALLTDPPIGNNNTDVPLDLFYWDGQ